MKYFKKFVCFLLIAQSLCCIDSRKGTVHEKGEEVLIIKDTDTVLSTYRFKIVNDSATLKIRKITKDLKNHFILNLDYKGEMIFTKKLYKKNILDKNHSGLFLDSINKDYTLNAGIKDIEFLFTRGSTLYFKSILENTEDKKQIYGRFNVFYKSERKGLVYGWITDEVKILTL